jgi:hypothetical protein
MMLWPPDLKRLKNSALGKYISKYMTPTIEVVRLLTLAPMALGAWNHNFWFIAVAYSFVCLVQWASFPTPRRAFSHEIRVTAESPLGTQQSLVIS